MLEGRGAQQQLLDHVVDRTEHDRRRDVLAALAVTVPGGGHAVPATPEQHDAAALQCGRGDGGEVMRGRLTQRADGQGPRGGVMGAGAGGDVDPVGDRKSTRLNSSHVAISYAVFCLKKKKKSKR